MLNIDKLKKQLSDTEAEMEQVKAHLYRCDGAVQTLKHLIAQAEAPEEAEDGSNP